MPETSLIEDLARPILDGFRSKSAVVILNLVLFIVVTSLPAFENAHHHWIFPIGAALLALEYFLTLALPGGRGARLDAQTARAAVLGVLAFLLIMGIVRHATILACIERCGFKLAGAAVIGATVFFVHGRRRERGFWSPGRCLLAALGCLVWAAFLVMRAAQAAPWAMDLVFFALAALLWLGRDNAAFLLASAGVLSGLAIRSAANEYVVIALGVVWGVGAPLAAVPAVERRLARRAAERGRREAERAARPLRRRVLESATRITAAVAVIAGLAAYAAGPIAIMTEPEKRQRYLESCAPATPVNDPAALSPLASRLYFHVAALSALERDVDHPAAQRAARDYVVRELKAAGYRPRLIPYDSQWLASVPNKTEFWDVEAVLGRAPADAQRPWIIGAHYDAVAGTPGADDNASGVAVLIEAARLLKKSGAPREIRFVAFGTEEPPAFGTRNMGSYRYARLLEDSRARIHGMISLEMLGYYNPRRGSQLYPPFMHLLYPDDGDFVGIVSDWRSRALGAEFAGAWRRASRFPLTRAVLPGPASELALSDQLNFWSEGFPALMLSDTAFYRNPNYHEAGDKPGTLDYEKMARVARALAATLAAAPRR